MDLNNDNQVDYLRVIESVEKRTHFIIIQSVLDRDVYQDVATIEVEKDNQNNIHVQVVGDVYMYGQNYIYEPVYYNTPRIYASFGFQIIALIVLLGIGTIIQVITMHGIHSLFLDTDIISIFA